MKRFIFRLQAVLTLRQRSEQEALEAYAHAMRQHQAATEVLKQCEMELSDARRQWLHDMADGCPAIHAAQVLAYCHSIEERRTEFQSALDRSAAELSLASQRMLSTRQQREAVEQFMERQRAQHEQDVRIEEQKLMEELAGRMGSVSLSGSLLQKQNWN